jgi:hypothetical protein
VSDAVPCFSVGSDIGRVAGENGAKALWLGLEPRIGGEIPESNGSDVSSRGISGVGTRAVRDVGHAFRVTFHLEKTSHRHRERRRATVCSPESKEGCE